MTNDAGRKPEGAGGLDFSNYYTPLSAKVEPGGSYADAKRQGAVLGWGQFLTVIINFLIHRVGAVHRNQGYEQVEERGGGGASPWADGRGETADREFETC